MRLPTVPIIPGYDLLEVLGAGGMGVVWKARQRRLDRIVALKLIRPELVGPEVVASFQREAQAVARLAHPNIVTIHDADEVDGTHFLVMELVEGIDLGRLVADRGPLPVDVACTLARQAALALQHANERGVVHRDVKPSNLMAARPSGMLKMLDLGLARWRGGSGGSTTSFANLVGTPDFVAPEQIETPGKADARSDLYSLGCTLYYLLTGQVPFPAPALAHKLDGHRWQTPTPLAQVRPGVAPPVQELVSRLLAKRPEERHQSAAELAAALTPLTAGTTVTVTLPAQGRYLSLPSVTPTCLAFAPGGAALVVASAGRLACHDVQTGQERWRQPLPPPSVAQALAFTPDGKRLIVGGDALSARDARTGAVLRTLKGHDGPTLCVAALADSKHCITGGADEAVVCWNLRTGKRRMLGGLVTERHWGPVQALALHADGAQVLSGSADGTVRVWDLPTGREVRCVRVGKGVQAVGWSGDEPLAAGDGWMEQHALGATTCRAFSADSRTFATGGSDGAVRLWDVASGRELACHRAHHAAVSCVAFAHDGRIASGGADHRVWISDESTAWRPLHGE